MESRSKRKAARAASSDVGPSRGRSSSPLANTTQTANQSRALVIVQKCSDAVTMTCAGHVPGRSAIGSGFGSSVPMNWYAPAAAFMLPARAGLPTAHLECGLNVHSGSRQSKYWASSDAGALLRRTPVQHTHMPCVYTAGSASSLHLALLSIVKASSHPFDRIAG